jgi:hypothetical protein
VHGVQLDSFDRVTSRTMAVLCVDASESVES